MGRSGRGGRGLLSPATILLVSGHVGNCPSVRLSARRAARCPALVVQHCQPAFLYQERVAPLCQSLRGMGAERLLQKSSATGGIMVCLGNRGLIELSAPPSSQHQASAAA